MAQRRTVDVHACIVVEALEPIIDVVLDRHAAARHARLRRRRPRHPEPVRRILRAIALLVREGRANVVAELVVVLNLHRGTSESATVTRVSAADEAHRGRELHRRITSRSMKPAGGARAGRAACSKFRAVDGRSRERSPRSGAGPRARRSCDRRRDGVGGRRTRIQGSFARHASRRAEACASVSSRVCDCWRGADEAPG